MISAILRSSVWETSPELSSKDFLPPSLSWLGQKLDVYPLSSVTLPKLLMLSLHAGTSLTKASLCTTYKSVVSYDTTEIPIFSTDVVANSDKVTVYDSLDADVVQSYMEFSLASLVFYALKEGATSEQSSRMTAMDNSSKNASEMIDKLRISFNRTRQAVITGELIEIISGAAAL